MHPTNDQHFDKPETNQDTQPGSATPADEAGKQWTDHEHQADRARLQAQKLVEETGSPELAKHAIDGATKQPEQPAASADESEAAQFARRLGFASYAALEAMSTPVLSDNGQLRMVGAMPSGKWIIWKRGRWNWHQEFDTWQQVRDALVAAND
ncbi:MAG: hypothetical protein JNM18_18010 [Planctomycetaceae bacterium]|nr:hypothetical protein [Planctomycetaceae bacterium]